MNLETIETVRFIVYGPPVPKARPRVFAGHAITPKRTRQYERAVAEVGAMWCGRGWALTGHFRVRATFVFADKRRRDVDNCLKAVLDALNGIAWNDDDQVVRATATKALEPGGQQRTEVVIDRVNVLAVAQTSLASSMGLCAPGERIPVAYARKP